MTIETIYDCISIKEFKEKVEAEEKGEFKEVVVYYEVEHDSHFVKGIKKVQFAVVSTHKRSKDPRIFIETGRPAITEVIEKGGIVRSFKVESFCEDDKNRHFRVFTTDSKP